MVELVDTLVLGTSALGRGGSTPSRGTIKMNKIKFILLFIIINSFIISQDYKEIIYLKNGSIIKGEIVKKTEHGAITVQSGDNTFTFNYDDILKIEKTTRKKISNPASTERIEAARAYLEETREKINAEKKGTNNFYYMLSGGIAQEEQLNDIDYAASFLGFYWNIQDNILLGFNQTGKIKHIGGFEGQDPYGECGTYWDCDVWFYRRLYGISYIEFQKKKLE